MFSVDVNYDNAKLNSTMKIILLTKVVEKY